MATIMEWIRFYIEYVTEIFLHFIWPFKSYIDNIDNKAVLITGCDSGFGHELALELNEKGFTVFATCLHPDKQQARSLLIKAKNPKKLHLIPIDVSNDLTVQLAHEEVIKILKSSPNLKLWAIVNNAGICPYNEIEWGPFEDIKKVFDVNTFGQILVTRTFLPLIRSSKGRIINVNSVACRISIPGMVPYCMSKFASLAFTEGLRREMRKFKVKVISIEPYFYSTSITDCNNIQKLLEKSWASTDSQIRYDYGVKYFKRMNEQISMINPFTEKDTSAVIEAMKDAVINNHPKYHYLVANFIPRLLCSIISYITPQETIESLFTAFSIFNGRSCPFPDVKQN